MAQETEKIKIDFPNIRYIIKYSNENPNGEGIKCFDYHILYSAMNGDAAFIKIEMDSKIFYGIFEFIEDTPEEFSLETLMQELIKYSSFHKTKDLEFFPYEMERYYKVQDTEKDLQPLFCDMSVPLSEIFELFGDSGEMHIIVEEKEISPEEAYQLPEWEG
jgi:hypothetical protein